MHVRVRPIGVKGCHASQVLILLSSRLSKIEELRKKIQEKLDIPPDCQRLFYGGKLLENGFTLHDYNIKLNDVIQLMNLSTEKNVNKKSDLDSKADVITKSDDIKNDNIQYEDANSLLYETGDLIDFTLENGWFEGKIIKILRKVDICDRASSSNVNVDNIEKNIKAETKNKNLSSPKTPKSKGKSQNGYNKKSPITPNHGIKDCFTGNKSSDNIEDNDVSINDNIPDLDSIMKNEKDLIFKIHTYDDDDLIDRNITQIRPRSKKEIKIKELTINQRVMVNYNIEEPQEIGSWYDFIIHEIKKQRKYYELHGTLYQTNDIFINDIKIKCQEKIYDIETPVPLKLRSEEQKKNMVTETEKRIHPFTCTTCKDIPDTKCKDCGCVLCAGKNLPEKIILCDECNAGYHLFCLNPPLENLPDEDWYCSNCKRDSESIIAPGKGKQKRKTYTNKNNRDWGRGMACVGKTQTCSMPPNHFGPIPGIEVGMMWRFRIQLSESGVHRPPVSGIHGRDVDGAYSIVLSGGYEDDTDDGFEFTYTGSGGRDLSGNKRTADQSSDQMLTRENRALAKNCAVKEINENGDNAKNKWRDGKPVRVVRSFKMLKHFPKYAPKEGIRYDGIYKVVKYYPETGKSGFRVWKYLLRRDDPNPAPWEENAKRFEIIYPEGYLEAEAEKQALKEKEKLKNAHKRKHILQENNDILEENENKPKRRKKETSGTSSPPPKRKTRSSLKSTDKIEETVETVTTKNRKKKKAAEKGSLENNSVNPFTIAATKKHDNFKTVQNENVDPEQISEECKIAIEKDSLNKKIWNECLEMLKNNGKQGMINKVTELFLCIICQDLVTNPTTTSCSHNFCISCLKLAYKSTHRKQCPCCRADLSHEESNPNEALKNALQTLLPGYDLGKR